MMTTKAKPNNLINVARQCTCLAMQAQSTIPTLTSATIIVVFRTTVIVIVNTLNLSNTPRQLFSILS